MKRRYLLVDDNREFAENMAEILTDSGGEVTTVENAASALEQLRDADFDVLVTDMRMPGMSGAELLKEVRQRDPGLPVVVVSAFAANDQLEEAHRLGLLAYVGKTSGPARLLELLRRARRDAVVFAICEDDARVESARAALSEVGVTVCTVSSPADFEGHPAPLAAIVENPASPLVAAVKARFPTARVVRCVETPALCTALEGSFKAQ